MAKEKIGLNSKQFFHLKNLSLLHTNFFLKICNNFFGLKQMCLNRNNFDLNCSLSVHIWVIL